MTKPDPQAKLPDKLYFKVGEVSRIAGVPAYVLRFWETEFPRVRPRRTESGQRLYRRGDVERILEIKRLLYEERYTIAGARRRMSRRAPQPQKGPRAGVLSEIREELLRLRDLVD